MSSVNNFPVGKHSTVYFLYTIHIYTHIYFCNLLPRTSQNLSTRKNSHQKLPGPVHDVRKTCALEHGTCLSFPESVSEKYFAGKVSLPYATRRSTIARCVCATCTSVPDPVRWWILHGLMLGFYLGMSWRAPGHHHVHLDGDW